MIDIHIERMLYEIKQIRELMECALMVKDRPKPEHVPLSEKKNTQFGLFQKDSCQCDKCGRKFSNKGHLGNHLRHAANNGGVCR